MFPKASMYLIYSAGDEKCCFSTADLTVVMDIIRISTSFLLVGLSILASYCLYCCSDKLL